MPARTRYAVLALSALAVVVIAITLKFGLSTDVPTAPLPNPATTAAAVQEQAAVSPVPNSPTGPASPIPEPASPEPPPPATIPSDASPAPAPDGTSPAQTAPSPSPPATTEPAPPSAYAPLLTWMRQQFGHFLDHMGAPFANLSEPQRDALFAEFLAWHRTRSSADPPKAPAP